MLRVRESENAAAAIHYLGELKRDDYYIKGQEIPATWLGKDAARLNLEGEVKEKDFIALANNRDPNTGKRLTQRDKSNRRPGYDATLSAWKSASVMDALYGCTEIREAFWQAGDDMMTQTAEPEMRTRVRVAGKDEDRVTGSMIGAAFRHLRARPVDGRSDMHLHTHYYIVNATFDAVEGKWKAAQLGDFKAKAPDLELDFDARFARSCGRSAMSRSWARPACRLPGFRNPLSTNFRSGATRLTKKRPSRAWPMRSGNTKSALLFGKAKARICRPTC